MADRSLRDEAYAALTGSSVSPTVFTVCCPDDLVRVFKKLLSLPTGKTARVTIEELRP